MSLSRYFRLLAVGVVLVGLAACSTPTSTGGSTTVTVTKVGTVPWLAVQDGSGAWQTLSGSSFLVTNNAGKYGVAWACTLPSGQPLVQITQETTSDSTAVTTSCQSTGSATYYTVSGTVNLPSPYGSAFVGIGNGFTTAYDTSGIGSASYTVSGVPSGQQTILAYDTSFGKMARGTLTVNNDQTGVNIYLSNGADITTVDSVSLASSPPGGETPVVGVELVSNSVLTTLAFVPNATGTSYPLVPSLFAQAGDKYVLVAGDVASTSTTDDAQAEEFVSQSPSASAILQPPAVLVSNAGVGVTGPNATATWGSVTFASGGLTGYAAEVAPSTMTSATWSVVVTGSWLGSATSYDFPDFSATTNWNGSWNFPTGVSASATVMAMHANTTLDAFVAFNQSNNYSDLPNGTDLEFTERVATGTY